MVALAEPQTWSNLRENRNPRSGSRPRMPRVALVPAKRIREDAYPRFSNARLGLRYKPETGTWLSRDPIGERGEKNVYGFVRNNPVKSADLIGLVAWTWTPLGPNVISGNLIETGTQVIAPLG